MKLIGIVNELDHLMLWMFEHGVTMNGSVRKKELKQIAGLY